MILVASTGCKQSEPPATLIRNARLALATKDYDKAITLVQQISNEAPEWQAAQLVAGEAATKNEQLDDAIAIYLKASQDDSTEDGQLALFSAAEIYLHAGQLEDAESFYKAVLKHQPTNGVTNSRLALLLMMTGRNWEAQKHFEQLIRGGSADYRELSMAADLGRPILQPDMLNKWRTQNPEGKFVRLAIATDAFKEGDTKARTLLADVVRDFPDLVPAQARLGELLVESNDSEDFAKWHKSLTIEADESADIWFVRGLYARAQKQPDLAAECFWRTITIMPVHRRGFTALGQVLSSQNASQANAIVDHATRMAKLTQSVDRVLFSEGQDAAAMQQAAELLEQFGRIWETCAWAIVGRNNFPNAQWHEDILSRQSHKLTADLPVIKPIDSPTAAPLDQLRTQISQLIAETTSRMSATDSPSGQQASIRFELTESIAFQYYNADDPSTEGVRMFEQTGGGVGVIDFDLDGTPDIFLPQGTQWPSNRSMPVPSGNLTDRLFRNTKQIVFTDVTSVAIDNDSGFGQGCAVGDFDNDGFPDIYVANIGRNCLYRNMGDGSFCDVTTNATITDIEWTTSTLICDLNADGLPDLFDVNYLSGEGVYEKICQKRGCSPSVFDGATDRLLLNAGDGSFEAVANATPAANSKGLGVIAFEQEVSRRPLLFISNDQVANFLLENEPTNAHGNIAFRDVALLKGVAFSDQGLPMACMGIGADDFDGNGLLDLFVTNFQNESNNLYLQDSPGLYRDSTNAMGLQAASIPFTSWGTQSLDADLDGWPDIAVANGHVDDGRPFGGDYHQRPQFFHNRNGTFEELNSQQAGAWVDQPALGRGMARVDWNQDGLPEFIISNINSPLSVLMNTSSNTGHFLRLKLVATQTARDATGSVAILRTGNMERRRQLTAGGGYMASNESVIEFGLGHVEAADLLTIHWPSGATSVLQSPPVNCVLTIVEGLKAATQSSTSGLKSYPVNAN